MLRHSNSDAKLPGRPHLQQRHADLRAAPVLNREVPALQSQTGARQQETGKSRNAPQAVRGSHSKCERKRRTPQHDPAAVPTFLSRLPDFLQDPANQGANPGVQRHTLGAQVPLHFAGFVDNALSLDHQDLSAGQSEQQADQVVPHQSARVPINSGLLPRDLQHFHHHGSHFAALDGNTLQHRPPALLETLQQL